VTERITGLRSRIHYTVTGYAVNALGVGPVTAPVTVLIQ